MKCFTCDRPLGICTCIKPFKHMQTKAERQKIQERLLRNYQSLGLPKPEPKKEEG